MSEGRADKSSCGMGAVTKRLCQAYVEVMFEKSFLTSNRLFGMRVANHLGDA